jgi:hypothetical protein
MTTKLLLVGSVGILLCFGFFIFRDSFTRTVELEQEATPKPHREEEILRAFFRDELAQKTIAHLSLYDLQSFEDVAQPRPQLSEIVEHFGAPDSVVEEDLSAFGVSQRVQVHYYGRLGLVIPVGRTDEEIFWIHVAGRPTGYRRHP